MKCPNCGREGAVALSGNANSLIEGYCNLCGEDFSLPFWWAIGKGYNGTKEKKEEYTMQISYNGFTGELVKMERTFAPYPYVAKYATYDLTITVLKEGVCADVHFTGAKMEDLQFHGGAVTFDG